MRPFTEEKTLFFDKYWEKFRPGKIAVVGVPLDQNSSFLKGAAQAPPLTREALFSYSANLFTENGIDLGHSPGWLDVGDLTLTGEPAAFAEIEQAADELLSAQMRLVTIGGDHSITYPLIWTPIPIFMTNWMAIPIPTLAPLPGSWRRTWPRVWSRWGSAR